VAGNWERLLALDDELIRLFNLFRRIEFTLRRTRARYGLKDNAVLKDRHKGERCFIVGNGPSINSQDLTLLKDETTFFCNFFFKHPRIREIRPSYYAVADGKLATGEWDISILEEIRESCPDVTLFLSATFQDNPRFAPYLNTESVFWLYVDQLTHMGFRAPIDLTRGLHGFNIIKVCVSVALYMGFKDIYLLGVDNDGTFRDMLGESSHFYDAPPEGKDYERDLWVVASGFRGWTAIANRYRGSDHRIVNLTAGGLLFPFPRRNYIEVMEELHNGTTAT
jgi:hypothetical protein